MSLLFNNIIARKLLEKFLVDGSNGAVVKLSELHINTMNKEASLALLLQGETEPLTVKIAGYSFGEGNVLFIREISASKPWVETILKSLLSASENRINLPDSPLSAVVSKLL
ncbi:MAG: hypothetical protein JNL74_06370 [Fibrobacteres bacterium]|nr:hypothetical protein [Fibrobacterota bacterium]